MVDIVFTGGGTAGHVTPNLALIPDLISKGYQVAYIGQKNSIEKKLVEAQNIPFSSISAGKLRRYIDFQNITDIFKILVGFLQSLWHLQKLKPKLLFSKGGFVSSPVVWAAFLHRIPIIIHESDISPGLANKLSLPFAKVICFSFPETAAYLPKDKSKLTGLPIRDELRLGDIESAKRLCGFDSVNLVNKPCIVFMGGSQGSKVLNGILRENLQDLLALYNVCHLCGAGELDTKLNNLEGYCQFEYISEELADLLAMADLLVSRAGATSIFEFLALNKPSLLIPLPLSASRGDQILNAASFEKQGFAHSITEEELQAAPQQLRTAIEKALSDSKKMQTCMETAFNDNVNKELPVDDLSLASEKVNATAKDKVVDLIEKYL